MTSSNRSSGDRSRDEVLAGEYVLGVLSLDDRRKVEARIVLDADFAAMVQRWEDNLAAMDEDYQPEAPPAWVFPRIEERLHGRAAPATAKAGLWQSIAFWRGLATLSLVAVAGFGITTMRLIERPETIELTAALTAEGSGVSYMSTYDIETGLFRMTPVASGAQKEKSLELWLIKGKNPAVSLGVLPQTGEGELLVPLQWRDRIEEGDIFAISLEAYGGSPTGKAQGPILALGSTKLIRH